MEDKKSGSNYKKNESRRNRRAQDGHKPRIREVRDSDDSSEEETIKRRIKKARTTKKIPSVNNCQQSPSTVNVRSSGTILSIYYKIVLLLINQARV